MKRLLLALLLVALFIAPAQAMKVLETATTCTGTDVTITTTTEKLIASQQISIPSITTFYVRVRVYGTMTTGADSTAYIVAVRRTNISGTVLGGQINEAVKIAAGGIEAFFFEWIEERNGDFASLTYASTVDMGGATADTTVTQNCITVDILN